MSDTTIVGTPVEVGGEIFRLYCIPAIKEATKHATPLELTQLYCGFLQGAYGSMFADFGQDETLKVGQLMLDAFAQMDLQKPKKTPPLKLVPKQ